MPDMNMADDKYTQLPVNAETQEARCSPEHDGHEVTDTQSSPTSHPCDPNKQVLCRLQMGMYYH